MEKVMVVVVVEASVATTEKRKKTSTSTMTRNTKQASNIIEHNRYGSTQPPFVDGRVWTGAEDPPSADEVLPLQPQQVAFLGICSHRQKREHGHNLPGSVPPFAFPLPNTTIPREGGKTRMVHTLLDSTIAEQSLERC